MLGIYLSGTGNTKYCIEKLLNLLVETAQSIPIENEKAADRKIQSVAAEIKNGKYPKVGIGIFYHIAGLFDSVFSFIIKLSTILTS
jgi:hypothetical protein